MQEEVFECNGVKSPVLLGGDASAAETVLCIHGNPGTNAEFREIGSEISKFARFIAPDMPGFAGAEKPENFDYSVAGYEAFITDLLEQTGIGDVHLVLHDLGVPWGMNWAAKNGDRVKSIVMFDGPPVSDYRWHFLAKIWRTPVIGELFWALNNLPSSKMILKIGSPRPYPPGFVEEMYKRIDKPSMKAILKMYRALDPAITGAAIEAGFAGRDVPALILWGAHDPYVNKKYAELTKRKVLPAAEVVVFEDSGHWPHVDNPERFAREVLGFLRAQLNP